MDRGAWQAMFHRVANSQTRLKRLSTRACTCEHPVERSFDLPLCIFFYIFTSIYFQHLEQCLAYSISYRQIHIHQTKLQNTFPKINSASLWMVDLRVMFVTFTFKFSYFMIRKKNPFKVKIFYNF